ncbi:MAG: UPF0028 protein YchK [uncultured Thiotrichaceae bacterium]|uniref:UPF0028 protein YchK n=1 Tax=uncultured Thiotrichaceae bacterium TaxID=298394 RepID=A0A6S6SGB4_9GAMM|nr:MAG: UPF0028 protein YchK [uncultured Thiotrichaceae bacterium]
MKNRRLLKVGVALGSGGAKGWAHIGVLNALERMGIRPSIVAGTSIGALVGAAYACQRLDKLENWVLPMTWKDIIGYLDVSVKRGGLIEGDKLLEAIQQETCDDILIEETHKLFSAVATELGSGQEIWLREGSLLDAVRASIAMPGLFTPVERDGEWLTDGALVNPVPVSLCRAMGADIVIAVNVNTDNYGRYDLDGMLSAPQQRVDLKNDDHNGVSMWDRVSNQLVNSIQDRKDMILSRIAWGDSHAPGMYEVFGRTINIMQDRIARSRLAGDPPDVLLTPYVHDIAVMDFHKAKQAIAEGESSVYRMRPALEHLKQATQQN